MPESASGQVDEIVRFARATLSSAVLSDTLDSMGLIHQTMEGTVRPLDEALVLCGRARTGNFRDVYGAEGGDQDLFTGIVELLDDVHLDDVLVLACGRSGRIPVWGDIFSTAAHGRGSAGCVTDGLIRDAARIRALPYPVFSAGHGASGTTGRGVMVSSDIPVRCAGVWVSPGDLVFGDVDGVVVVPQRVEEEAIRQAAAIAERERDLLDDLRRGLLLAEVYRKYGTL